MIQGSVRPFYELRGLPKWCIVGVTTLHPPVIAIKPGGVWSAPVSYFLLIEDENVSSIQPNPFRSIPYFVSDLLHPLVRCQDLWAPDDGNVKSSNRFVPDDNLRVLCRPLNGECRVVPHGAAPGDLVSAQDCNIGWIQLSVQDSEVAEDGLG